MGKSPHRLMMVLERGYATIEEKKNKREERGGCRVEREGENETIHE